MSDIQQALWPDDSPTDPKEVTEGYNKLASTYKRDVMKDGWGATFDMINNELGNQLPKRKGPIKLLDAGCGDGMLPEVFDFKPYDVSLYGIDGSTEMLAISKGKGTYKHLEIVNVVERFPFADETFDLCVANGLLGYLADYKPIYEFMRVMKVGGHFMFTMRVTHYNERGWAKAIDDMSEKWTIVRKDPFDPFPNNPAYTHTYHLVCIMKTHA